MRLESLPVLLGVIVALFGAVLVFDGAVHDRRTAPVERRKRERPPRSRAGEIFLGVALLFMALALIMRDSWRYTNVAIMLAVASLVAGLMLNMKYVRGQAFGPSFGRLFRRRSTDNSEQKIRIR